MELVWIKNAKYLGEYRLELAFSNSKVKIFDAKDYIASHPLFAALKDQKRWKLKTNFDEEVDLLIDWVAKRYDHFEQTYNSSSS